MLPGNEEIKNSVKVYALLVVHTEVISMCVVPAKVNYKDSNSVYNYFSMLDNFCQGFLFKFSLMKNLRIKGHKSSACVKPLNGEDT